MPHKPPPPPIPRPLHERFWPKVDMSGGLDACWPWVGGVSEKRGGHRRGVIREASAGSRFFYAHVVALALFTDGEFEKVEPETGERLQACHSCNNALCCNGRHLYWGTRASNDLDRWATPAEVVVSVEDLMEALGLPFYGNLREARLDIEGQQVRFAIVNAEASL